MKEKKKSSDVLAALKWLIVPAKRMDIYKEEIAKSNINSLKTVCYTGLFICVVLTILSLPFINVLKLLPAYAGLTVLFLFLAVMTETVFKKYKRITIPFYYVFMLVLLGCAIIMGTIFDKNTNATTFLLFMLVLPMFIIDSPIRINFLLGCFCATFCVAVVAEKTGEIMRLDISNAVVVTLISMLLVSVNVNRKLHDFEVLKKEQELVDEQGRIINAIPTGIGVFEMRNGVPVQTFINDGFFRLMEDTREGRAERLGKNFMKNIHPDDFPKVAGAVARVNDGEDFVRVNCRALKGNGSYKWVTFSAAVAQRKDDFVLLYVTYNSIEEEVKNRVALEQSSAMLQAAIKSTNMTVWELDCIHNRIIQDDASIKKHGYGKIINNVPESLIDSGYFKQSSIMPYRKMYQKLMDTQKTVQGDFCVRINGKEGYWWEHIILTPVMDTNGNMIKAVGTSLDITDRKNREEQYYRQIGLMADTVDSSLIAKAQYNLSQHRLVSYTALRDDALNIEAGQELSKVLDRVLSAQTDEESRKQTRETLDINNLLRDFTNGKSEGSICYKRRVADRPFNYALLKYLVSPEPRTNDLYLFIYCYDNTHNVVERSIVKQLGSYEYESIGIIDVDTQDYVLEQGGGSFFSYISQSGHKYYDTCRPVILAAVAAEERDEMLEKTKLENVIKQLEKNSVFEFGYTITDASGRLHRKKLRFQYIDEKKKTILCSCSDITALYHQEQEQLLRLQKALTEAKQATQAKTEFLSRMSHDIRTPLNAILGITALAKDESDNPKVINEYLSTIDSSGRFLLGLINDILDINKIESGKIELRPEICSVSEYAEDINASIMPLMEKKHIDFELKMGCGLRYIEVDRIRHHQVFFNLLSNAAKYTPEYGHVEYITQPLKAPKGKVGIRNIIRDNGIGMNQAYMKSLFEPFTRDTNAVINQTEGSGLGLAIVKNIVDAMGGKITVNSVLGKGTEFIVDLFLPEVPSDYEQSTEIVSHDQSKLKGCRILLVEDNEINTRIATKLLEKKGCIVTTVNNGKKAVDYVSTSSENSIDVILMDIRMPVMNGLDAAKAIRELDREDVKHLPIIAMTADAFNEDINRTKQVGMNGHIPKPVEPDKLYKMIAEQLTKKN